MSTVTSRTLKRTKAFRSQGEAVMVTLSTTAVRAGMMMERLFRANGLTGTQYNVLRILRGAPRGGYGRSDIIDRLMLPHPDATRLIDRLDPVLDGIHQRIARTIGRPDSTTLIRICDRLLAAVQDGTIAPDEDVSP